MGNFEGVWNKPWKPSVPPTSQVFAPNDAAFADFLEQSGKTPQEILADVNLREILANHVVEG